MRFYAMSIMMALALFSGCAYMGIHGASVQNAPGIHSGITADRDCLSCHAGDSPQGPATPHPSFENCIHCHNDPV